MSGTQCPSQTLLAATQCVLRPFPFGDVSEREHGPQHATIGRANRRGCVFDASFGAVPPDKQCMTRLFDAALFTNRLKCRIFEFRSRLFVPDHEHFRRVEVSRLAGGPVRHPLGGRIERADATFGIGRDDGIADAVQRDLQLLALLVEVASDRVPLQKLAAQPNEGCDGQPQSNGCRDEIRHVCQTKRIGRLRLPIFEHRLLALLNVAALL